MSDEKKPATVWGRIVRGSALWVLGVVLWHWFEAGHPIPDWIRDAFRVDEVVEDAREVARLQEEQIRLLEENRKKVRDAYAAEVAEDLRRRAEDQSRLYRETAERIERDRLAGALISFPPPSVPIEVERSISPWERFVESRPESRSPR